MKTINKELLDEFAKAALTGVLSGKAILKDGTASFHPDSAPSVTPSSAAIAAYAIARKMLEERDKIDGSKP